MKPDPASAQPCRLLAGREFRANKGTGAHLDATKGLEVRQLRGFEVRALISAFQSLGENFKVKAQNVIWQGSCRRHQSIKLKGVGVYSYRISDATECRKLVLLLKTSGVVSSNLPPEQRPSDAVVLERRVLLAETVCHNASIRTRNQSCHSSLDEVQTSDCSL